MTSDSRFTRVLTQTFDHLRVERELRLPLVELAYRILAHHRAGGNDLSWVPNFVLRATCR